MGNLSGKFQQLKLRVWSRLEYIPFRFLSRHELPKLIFSRNAYYFFIILEQITGIHLNIPIGGAH